MMLGGVRRLIFVTVACMGLTAHGATDPPCVVCGEPTDAGFAVVHSNQAYAIHSYPCKSVWDRVVAAGRLEGVANPLTPGSDLFTEPVVAPTPFFPGSPIRWTLFLLGTMSLSGSLALLLGTALHKRPLACFFLGFLVPAVGMVLVPVLPAKESNPSTQEES